MKNIKFVVNTSNMHGYIAEQIDNQKLSPAWVIGLTWAHAMYICIIDELFKNGKI